QPLTRVPAAPATAPWKHYALDTLFQFKDNPFRYFYVPWQLARVLDEFKPDLVHVEQEPESLSLLQLSAFKARYGYRLIFIAWENVNPLRLGYLFRKLNFLAADAGIVGNQAALERLRRFGFKKRLDLIPQYGFGITNSEPSPREPGSPLVAGFVGRLVAQKGVRTLVEAARQLGNVRIRIAGDGPLADQFRTEPNVEVLGMIPRQELQSYWNSIDVLVLPSISTIKSTEQFGRVLVEAMGAGVPVIGSSSGAIPEVIGDAGLVFPEGNAGALADALRRIRDDEELRADLVRRGYERLQRHYSYDVIIGRTVDFYHQIMNDMSLKRQPSSHGSV
ncbi:MAG TPA: glycosyltransferase family 4 protein, partial [Roseiflexaceae bacterium]|nr:glycosyltransferase family 4 protein [Roseiflexaceae bacterium]